MKRLFHRILSMFHRMGCQIKNFRAIFQLSFDGYGIIILNAVGTADAYFIPADKNPLSGMILLR